MAIRLVFVDGHFCAGLVRVCPADGAALQAGSLRRALAADAPRIGERTWRVTPAIEAHRFHRA